MPFTTLIGQLFSLPYQGFKVFHQIVLDHHKQPDVLYDALSPLADFHNIRMCDQQIFIDGWQKLSKCIKFFMGKLAFSKASLNQTQDETFEYDQIYEKSQDFFRLLIKFNDISGDSSLAAWVAQSNELSKIMVPNHQSAHTNAASNISYDSFETALFSQYYSLVKATFTDPSDQALAWMLVQSITAYKFQNAIFIMNPFMEDLYFSFKQLWWRNLNGAQSLPHMDYGRLFQGVMGCAKPDISQENLTWYLSSVRDIFFNVILQSQGSDIHCRMFIRNIEPLMGYFLGLNKNNMTQWGLRFDNRLVAVMEELTVLSSDIQNWNSQTYVWISKPDFRNHLKSLSVKLGHMHIDTTDIQNSMFRDLIKVHMKFLDECCISNNVFNLIVKTFPSMFSKSKLDNTHSPQPSPRIPSLFGTF